MFNLTKTLAVIFALGSCLPALAQQERVFTVSSNSLAQEKLQNVYYRNMLDIADKDTGLSVKRIYAYYSKQNYESLSGWKFNFANQYYLTVGNDNLVSVQQGKKTLTFANLGEGVEANGLPSEATLVTRMVDSETQYVLTKPEGEVVYFALSKDGKSGRLIKKQLPGYTLNYLYDEKGQLVSVNSTKGVLLAIKYNEAGQLANVSRSDGYQKFYFYDNIGRLIGVGSNDRVSAENLSEKGLHLHYGDTKHPLLLTKVTNKGLAIFEARYDVIFEQIAFRTAPAKNLNSAANVPLVEVQWSDGLLVKRRNRRPVMAARDDSLLVYNRSGIIAEAKASKDGGAFVAQRTMTLENPSCLDCLVYEKVKFIEAKKRSSFHRIYADGQEVLRDFTLVNGEESLVKEVKKQNEQLVASTTYTKHAGKQLIASVQTPQLKTLYQYDTNGRKVKQSLTDENSQKQRITLYSYDNNSDSPTKIDGPRTDVKDITHYAYDESGNLIKEVNPVGHETSYEYDDNNQLIAIVDRNGIRTEHTYNNVGKIASTTKAAGTNLSATTYFTYSDTGRLIKKAEPNGQTREYEYNDRGQKILTRDQDGNELKIVYSFFGELVATRSFGKDGTLLQELKHEIGHESPGAVDISDESGIVEATYTFDGKVQSITDATGGVTQYFYTPLGDISRVVDARGVMTQYQYNGFGERTHEISASAGTITYTYDEAGNNIIQETLQNGIVIHNEYDAIDRLTRKTYQQAGEDKKIRKFDYDGCENGVGRLCYVEDAVSRTYNNYDIVGNYSSVVSEFENVSQTTGYQYNAKKQLTALTYPSGLVVNYLYSDNGQVTRVEAIQGEQTHTLVKDIQYTGIDQSLASLTWGNELKTEYDYNPDGRISSIQTGDIQQLTYQYDTVGNITFIDKGSRSSYNQKFTYDQLNRLTSESKGSYETQYSYDAAHNRTQRRILKGTKEVEKHDYGYEVNANRLISLNKQVLIYDANGNLIEDMMGKRKFDYDVTNRLTGFYLNNKLQATYGYNHKNQRVKKVLHRPSKKEDNYRSMYFTYLPEGWLQSEIGKDGNSQRAFTREYVWLKHKPIAQIETKYSAKGIAVHTRVTYLHSDHLNTPRVASTDNQKTIWRWESDAFGNAPKAKKSYLEKVSLRFPGQYYDSESGLLYNHHRDYDPNIGRYIQSDPIGLGGGINNYVYTTQNPLRFTDPTGEVVPAVIACAANPACVSGVANVGFRIWQGYKVTSAILNAYLESEEKEEDDEERKDREFEECMAPCYDILDENPYQPGSNVCPSDTYTKDFNRCQNDCLEARAGV